MAYRSRTSYLHKGFISDLLLLLGFSFVMILSFVIVSYVDDDQYPTSTFSDSQKRLALNNSEVKSWWDADNLLTFDSLKEGATKPSLNQSNKANTKPGMSYAHTDRQLDASDIKSPNNFNNKIADSNLNRSRIESSDKNTINRKSSIDEVSYSLNHDSSYTKNPSTSKSLSGMVVTKNGDPLPRATIMSTLLRTNDDDNSNRSKMVKKQVVYTNAQGKFSVQRLANEELEVQVVESKQYYGAKKVVPANSGSIQLIAMPKMEQILVIGGRVTGENNIPIPNVRVIPSNLQTAKATRTNSRGNYMLILNIDTNVDPTFHFLHDDYLEKKHRVIADKTSGKQTYKLNLQLRPKTYLTTVQGTVTGKGLKLRMVRIQLISPKVKRVYQAYSNALGKFKLTDVEPNVNYRLTADTSQYYKDYVEENVQIPASGAIFNIELKSI